jgi:inorganic pyrophosphatase
VVPARLIGLIEAEQTQDGKTFRNDRMLAVAISSRLYAAVHELDDLPASLLDEIEQFFINYNVMRDRVFKPIARQGAEHAWSLMRRNAEGTKQRR